MIESYEDLLGDEDKKAIVIGRVLGEKKENEAYEWIENKLGVPISNWLQCHQHWGNQSSFHCLPVYKEGTSIEFVYIFGLGRGKSFVESFAELGLKLAHHADKDRLQKLTIFWSSFTSDFGEEELSTFEAFIRGYFSYKLPSTLPRIKLTFHKEDDHNSHKYEETFLCEQYLAEKSFEYQKLLERPTELMNGDDMLKTFHRLAGFENVQYDYFEKNDLHSLGMGGILSASKETEDTPIFAKLSYHSNQLKNEIDFFLIGPGVINQKTKRIRNNNNDVQLIYQDRLGVILALLVFEEICSKRLPISLSVLCPISVDRDTNGGETVRLMNEEVFINDSAKKNLQAKVSDSISFAKQEKAKTIVSLASFTTKLATIIGGNYAFMISNDQKLQQKWSMSKAAVVRNSWLLPFADNRVSLPGSELEELNQLGKKALPTTWFHIEILNYFLNLDENRTHYSIREEAHFIVETLVELHTLR